MIEAKKVKQQVEGHWNTIAATLAPELTPAIQKVGKHVPCPVHGGKDGFRLFKDFNNTGGGICNTCGEFTDGFALIQWVSDRSFYETLKSIDECLGVTALPTTKERKVEAKAEQHQARRNQQKITEILNACQRMSWPLARYLKTRGLGDLEGRVPSDLMAAERLPYWDSVEGTYQQLGIYPAMIAVIRNLSGDIVTLHRTYLTPEGTKANAPNPKKIMPPAERGASAGCAIQLFKPTDDLAITEGIETALAVHLSTGLPVWAAISSTMLEQVQIPASVKNVFIMADKDRTGTGVKAAKKLAYRLAGRHNIKIVVPDDEIPEQEKSVDWMDVYLKEQMGLYECHPFSDGGVSK